MQIKAILFDFDGTLANTVDLIIATFEHTCRTMLGTVPPRAAIVNTFGLPLGDAMLALSGRTEHVEQMRDVYREYNNKHHDEMIKPIAGVQETLAALKEQGLKIAVVTSKKQPMVLRGISCLQLEQYIDAVIALEDTQQSKPHAEPMLAACAKLGVAPQECLCVGDSPFDLQSGRNAGARTVAVRYTAFAWEKIMGEGRPDYVIAQPQELLELVKRVGEV